MTGLARTTEGRVSSAPSPLAREAPQAAVCSQLSRLLAFTGAVGLLLPGGTRDSSRQLLPEGGASSALAEVASGATGKVQEGSGEGAGKGREGPRDQQLRVHIPGETSVFRDRSDRAGLCPGLQRGLLVSPLPREDGPVPSAA